MKNNIFIVKICGSTWEDAYQQNLFVTENKKTATDYVKKFNKLLKKWKKYYKQFENEYGWVKDEYVEQYSNRFEQLDSITQCYFETIEKR